VPGGRRLAQIRQPGRSIADRQALTLRDGHDDYLMTASGQILMAADTRHP
jgi:hypothetical protein